MIEAGKSAKREQFVYPIILALYEYHNQLIKKRIQKLRRIYKLFRK
jgi:hypothetical protein